MTTNEEFRQAVKDYEIALQDFNNAEDKFIDIAVYRFNAAAEKLDVLISLAKEDGELNYA